VTTRDDATRPARAFLSRQERFRSVASTNDVVRAWLSEGTPEVCLAVADEQTAGRGRLGRSWLAPSGAALPLSLGFRPTYVEADRLWRLSAVVALAMADAAEEVAGLPIGTLKLKWPNDIVVDAERVGRGIEKLAGVLGESEAAGGRDVEAVVGIGINVDWPRETFPAELRDTMTSLGELSHGRPVDSGELLEAFLERLEPRVLALRESYFDVAGWHARQITTGRRVRVETSPGTSLPGLAVGVDGATGALIIEADDGTESEVLAGEVTHVSLAGEEPEAAVRDRPAGRRGVTN
jgi:BirA family transcriptional regulator, biotin operon repressor / biotin---[acetyl-CoA-carboxylase] ligase